MDIKQLNESLCYDDFEIDISKDYSLQEELEWHDMTMSKMNST